MTFESLALPAVIWVALTSLVLLTSWDWRWCMLALGAQYVGVFILVASDWPIPLAAVKLVAGWMATAVLGMGAASVPVGWQEAQQVHPSGFWFRVLAAGLVGLVVISVAPGVSAWIPEVDQEIAWGGLVLIGMGLLQLGLSTHPLRVVMGLLTVLAGFEVLHAAVESATLLAGLLAVVNLGLALAGAYLMVAPEIEDNE